MSRAKVKYVSDADGNAVEVIVPIAVWKRIASAGEVAALLDEDGGTIPDLLPDGSGTRIGIDPVSGLPVFITPPGSPVLTMEDVKRAEEDW